ncbi:MAG: inositol monophosphatase [Methylobacterium sp.]|nr:inositol monophosphatase [Methylobacterium sp.]MCA3606487.1 inositol monophosphatase [Methylobacterium sp.]MCA3609931.1 inositol monophosphatase [Methylobacterium sp.]MCA3619392.1 inositol monophosphatase [Methylobacterium sp.]MCA3620199.1 inositol monophosphatase [Methylobacterium sp.]
MTDNAMLAARYHAVHGMALKLGETALSYFGRTDALEISMKGFQDWLTIADGMVEREFRAMIAEAFPGDAVMGEEQGGGASERLWIIDPIDGTANFARGDRQWCISIGFVLNGRPELGLIHAPALGEMWLARRGGGATLNGQPIRAALTSDLRRSTVECGWSTRRPLEDYLGIVTRLYGAGSSVKRSASGALGVAHVANGRTDGYVETHINSWDVAAGLVIAAEAGCRTNAFCSGNWVTEGNPILVAAPGVAEAISAIAGMALAAP